jgi:hypothetical protein
MIQSEAIFLSPLCEGKNCDHGRKGCSIIQQDKQKHYFAQELLLCTYKAIILKF